MKIYIAPQYVIYVSFVNHDIYCLYFYSRLMLKYWGYYHYAVVSDNLIKLSGSLCCELKCLGVTYLSDWRQWRLTNVCFGCAAKHGGKDTPCSLLEPGCWLVTTSIFFACMRVNITPIYIITFFIKLNKVVQYDAYVNIYVSVTKMHWIVKESLD